MPQTYPIHTYYLRELLDLGKIAQEAPNLPGFDVWRKERNLLLASLGENRYVCVFPYGAAVVFGQFADDAVADLLRRLTAASTIEADDMTNAEELNIAVAPDDYECLVDPDTAEGANLETVRVREISPDRFQLIAQALAQSIVLDALDSRLDSTMGFFDQVYSHLSLRGKMHTGTKEALKAIGTSGNTTLFAIRRLALLDKPDLAWEDDESRALYESLRKAYELEDRFAALQLKLDFIRSSSEAVLEAMSTRRSEMLELVIIILIAIEIIFALGGLYG